MKRKLTVLAVVLLLATASCTLCGCGSGDAESAFRKMEEAGFTTALLSGDMAETFLGGEGAPAAVHDIDTMLVVGDFLRNEPQLFALYFKNEDDAKDLYDILNSVEREKGEIVRIKGKCVYYIPDSRGKAALKAFEKA